MGDFIAVIIVAVIASVMFAGNNNVSFYPESVALAEQVCRSNGGWDRLVEAGFGRSKVECSNGAEFTYDLSEIRSKKP